MVDDKREESYLKGPVCLDWRMVATFSEDLGDASVEFARIVNNNPHMSETLSSETIQKIRSLSETTTEVLSQSLDCFFNQDVLGAESLKSKITSQLRNAQKNIQDDISKLEKEIVWQLSSLLNLFKILHETAIDIGDLIIAKVNQ